MFPQREKEARPDMQRLTHASGNHPDRSSGVDSLQGTGSQSVVYQTTASATTGNLVEMQILQAQPRHTATVLFTSPADESRAS